MSRLRARESDLVITVREEMIVETWLIALDHARVNHTALLSQSLGLGSACAEAHRLCARGLGPRETMLPSKFLLGRTTNAAFRMD
jgi:hypothetical protein